MGYACPVCEEPQADATHLANHLAFTAMTGGDDHEEWLDDNIPGWGAYGEDELAGEVVDLATEAEFPFEDVDGHGHAGHDHGIDTQQARARGSGALDDEAEAILDEARELTEAMQEGDADGESADGDETE